MCVKKCLRLWRGVSNIFKDIVPGKESLVFRDYLPGIFLRENLFSEKHQDHQYLVQNSNGIFLRGLHGVLPSCLIHYFQL